MAKYAMKKKMEELLKRPSGPGPAKYALPGTIGITTRDPRVRRYPAFSFGQRNELQSGDCSPGPKYSIKPNSTQRGVETAPRFSLYSRPRDPKPPRVPGPGKIFFIQLYLSWNRIKVSLSMTVILRDISFWTRQNDKIHADRVWSPQRPYG